MLKKLLVLGIAMLLVGGGTAFALGIGPAPGGDSGDDIESFPTETAESSGNGGDSGSDTDTGSAGTTTDSPFSFTVDNVEKCGETCRDVTTTLTNDQSIDASNVTIYTRIYAGNGTDGDVVWEGAESVGDLNSGESYTATKRVELSMSDAYAVQREDGWITVQTTVESDERTVTFTDQRQVS